MKFSLILPVYNVEHYLEHCIMSCLNQDILPEEYEIIIVIDGSTDGSYAIACQYATKYNNILVLKKKMGG